MGERTSETVVANESAEETPLPQPVKSGPLLPIAPLPGLVWAAARTLIGCGAFETVVNCPGASFAGALFFLLAERRFPGCLASVALKPRRETLARGHRGEVVDFSGRDPREMVCSEGMGRRIPPSPFSSSTEDSSYESITTTFVHKLSPCNEPRKEVHIHDRSERRLLRLPSTRPQCLLTN